MKKIMLGLALAFMVFPVLGNDILLPKPNTKGGKPLKEALTERKTQREFTNKELDMQTLSDLLWCTYGFNRDDKRVVPSSQNRQEISLYVVLKTGIYLYDAKENKLILKEKGDHRKSTGKQEFAHNAPLNLIIVGDLEKASNREAAFIDSGFLVQNLYLFCASEGNLGTVVRGYFDKTELHKLLNLGEKQEVTITQTVGYIQ